MIGFCSAGGCRFQPVNPDLHSCGQKLIGHDRYMQPDEEYGLWGWRLLNRMQEIVNDVRRELGHKPVDCDWISKYALQKLRGGALERKNTEDPVPIENPEAFARMNLDEIVGLKPKRAASAVKAKGEHLASKPRKRKAKNSRSRSPTHELATAAAASAVGDAEAAAAAQTTAGAPEAASSEEDRLQAALAHSEEARRSAERLAAREQQRVEQLKARLAEVTELQDAVRLAPVEVDEEEAHGRLGLLEALAARQVQEIERLAKENLTLMEQISGMPSLRMKLRNADAC